MADIPVPGANAVVKTVTNKTGAVAVALVVLAVIVIEIKTGFFTSLVRSTLGKLPVVGPWLTAAPAVRKAAA